ncbi:DUF3188 domain-containing protein [Zhihengliuella flava]|uniref:Uncharacterized protein n=1 Tax=Zhihengliuella flava TaxID=1285193 RepID=A0A931GFF7_9MICC|nr:DUF3188 domain-containing protein [Zhihengliuella flava]MBG6085338.1 hypothetical protein [Zhihengliuella flava]
MLSIPWDALSTLYKVLVASSMGISAVGIVLALIGAFNQATGLIYAGSAIIVVGVLLHVAGLMVRGRDARAYRMMQSKS